MILRSVRFRAEQVKVLEKYAKDNHLSIGWCIRKAVDEWIEKLKS